MAQINKPSEHFNTVLYTGNGSTQSITGVNFKPDWVWIKNRSITANHHLFDVARGATKYILTNSNNAEATDAQQLQSFDSDGFTVGTNGNVNGSGNNIVAWNWLADNTSGSSNTDGDITSNVSVNSTAGFSIVSFVGNGGTNQTIGHGLSQKPDLIIAKNRDISHNWRVWHKSYNATNDIFYLNTTNAKQSNSDAINSVQDTTFTATANSSFIGNGNNVIAYCWHEVKGYSKFGSYTGNGNANGTFVYTGFKPAFLIVKPAVTADNWVLMDNTRDGGINGLSKDPLYPNNSFVEGTTDQVDFVSNGVKIRNSGGTVNRSGEPFIYMAFAENPLVGTNNIPCTAR